jgi:hypothetical protein
MEANLIPPLLKPLVETLKLDRLQKHLTPMRVSGVVVVLAAYFSQTRLSGLLSKKSIKQEDKSSKNPEELKDKVGVNKQFYSQLRYVLKICIPSYKSKTLGILVLHTLFLILRTYLSVVVARLDGRLVKDLVAADGPEFLTGLGYWFLVAVPATYVNSMVIP